MPRHVVKEICTHIALWCFPDLVGWTEALWIAYENNRGPSLPLSTENADKIAEQLETLDKAAVDALHYGRFELIDSVLAYSVIDAALENLVKYPERYTTDPAYEAIAEQLYTSGVKLTVPDDSWSVSHEILFQGTHWIRRYFRGGIQEKPGIEPYRKSSLSTETARLNEHQIETDKIASSNIKTPEVIRFNVYTDWEKPKHISAEKQLDGYYKAKDSNVIWINEIKPEYCHLGHPVEMKKSLESLLKVMLLTADKKFVSLIDMYTAIHPKEVGKVSKETVMNNPDDLSRAVSELNGHFDGCFGSSKTRWRYGDPKFQFQYETTFKYCFIQIL